MHDALAGCCQYYVLFARVSSELWLVQQAGAAAALVAGLLRAYMRCLFVFGRIIMIRAMFSIKCVTTMRCAAAIVIYVALMGHLQ